MMRKFLFLLSLVFLWCLGTTAQILEKNNQASTHSRGLEYNGEISLLIITPDPGGSEALRAELDAVDFISATSFPQAELPSIQLSDLIPYDIIIVFNQKAWQSYGGISPDIIGDVLAQYLDAGGALIENLFAMHFASAVHLGGSYQNGGYSAFTVASTVFNAKHTMGTVYEPDHPTMTDITTFSCVNNTIVLNNGIATGATRIADWNNGQILFAVKDNVVSCNFLPMLNGMINYVGDGTTFYANAAAWLMMNKFNPDAPAAPSNFMATAGTMGALSAELSWTNPIETYSGDTLTGLTAINIFRNGVLTYTLESPEVGAVETFTDNDISEAGIYFYEIQSENEQGANQGSTASIFIGEDVPGAPTNITLEAIGDNGSLSWVAPTEGLHGGYINNNTVTYNVIRMPDNAAVSAGISETEFLDTSIPELGAYYYTVTTFNTIGPGGTGESNTALLNSEGVLMYETFDLEQFTLPPGWQKTGMTYPWETWQIRNGINAGGTSPELQFPLYMSYPGTSRLVTAPIGVEGYSQLRLNYKHEVRDWSSTGGADNDTVAIDVSFDGGTTWSNIWKYEITQTLPSGNNEIYFDVPSGASTLNLGFRFDGVADNTNMRWCIDNLILNVIYNNDLTAVSVSGNTTPAVGTENHYSVTIRNLGLQTQSDYTVKLMKEGGIELASSEGTAIEFSDSITYELPWTPQPGDKGSTYLYGIVELNGDEKPGNDHTSNIDIVVQPDDIYTVVIIGEDQTIYPDFKIPFNFNVKNSLSQTIYYPDEIGISDGAIAGIAYTDNFSKTLSGKEIRIWMGETRKDNLTGGMVDPDSLVLLFEGYANFPTGVNNIFIPFDQPYIYMGGTLAVYTQRVWDSYDNGSYHFHSTNDPGSSRTRTAYSSDEILDPANPPYSFLLDWQPNLSLYFLFEGLGSLAGNVTDGNNTIEYVQVKLLGTNTVKTTDGYGNYEFPYVVPGIYTVEFSKFGYETITVENVVIEEGDTLNATITPINQYTVTGIAKGADGQLLEDALVNLKGYDDYYTMTNNNGEFEIEGVFIGPYTLKVDALHYETYIIENLVVGDNINLGTIILSDALLPPGALAVNADNHGNGNALLSWVDAPLKEFRWDDGVAPGQIGDVNGTLNTVFGSVHLNDAALYEISWLLTDAGGLHNTVKIWVFGLNENGNPNKNDILYEVEDVPNINMRWNTYQLPVPVETPKGFMVGISCNGYLSLATDSGTDPEWPFQEKKHFYVFDITSEDFTPIETYGFPQNYMIRAFGEDHGEIPLMPFDESADSSINGSLIPPARSLLVKPLETDFPLYHKPGTFLGTKEYRSSRNLTGFNVYLDDLTNPLAEGVTETTYLLTGLDDGSNHTAGVQSVYSSGVSDIVTLDFNMVYSVAVTIDVTTNSGESAEGAVVTLTNNELGQYKYTGSVNSDGEVVYSSVRKGVYSILISLPLFENYYIEGVNIEYDLTYSVELLEKLTKPGFATIDLLGQDNGNALFSWADTPEREFRCEGGVVESQMGSGSGTLNTVFGSAHRNDALLNEMSWFLTNEGGPHDTVKVWVVGLDENGYPNAGNILYEKEGIPNIDMQWNTYAFPIPVEAPNGFLIGVSYSGFIGIGLDSGFDPEWPYQPDKHFVVTDITSGNFNSIETYGLYRNFLIRAYGEDYGEITYENSATIASSGVTETTMFTNIPLEKPFETGAPVYSNQNVNSGVKAWEGFNIYLDDLINPIVEGVMQNEYLYINLEEGSHTAGVQSVFSTGVSDVVTVDFDMVYRVEVAVEVTTNTGQSPEGAVVTLANEELEQYMYTGTVNANGEIVFVSVRKGLYKMNIILPLYHNYYAEGINIQEDLTYTAELIEIIDVPNNLMVDTENAGSGNALFSWNNGPELDESFEDGVIPEGWTQIINNTGSGSSGDFTWQINGEVVLSNESITPHDGDYQAFIMWDYTHQDEWLITPEFIASADDLVFWYYGTNGSIHGDNYYVKVSTDGGNSWNILWNASDLPAADNHYEVAAVIDLSEYVGQEIQIAWNNVDGDGGGIWYAWAIDDISVGDMKINVRDLVHVSGSQTLQQGHNFAAKDGLFRPRVNPEDMLPIRNEGKSFNGFNVYLDNLVVPVAEAITDYEYLFTGLSQGIHAAGIQSVYTSGTSEIITIDFEIISTEFPNVAINPNALVQNFNTPNGQATELVQINNSGAGQLYWNATVEYLSSTEVQAVPEGPVPSGAAIGLSKGNNTKPGSSIAKVREDVVLHYDNENYDAIGLTSGGTFTVAARFPAGMTAPYTGYEFQSVDVYINDAATSATLKIWGAGTTTTPGMLLHQQSFSGTGWLTLELSSPLVLSGADIWAGYEVTHAAGVYPAGCDAGPANTNGDWISTDGNSWEHLSGLGLNYNWNIRANLSGNSFSWLSISPTSGVVEGNSTSNLEVHFDATGLENQIYTANILFNSNDPETPLMTIPVTMALTVGEDEKELSGINVYPNPTTGLLYISVPAEVVEIRMINSIGKVVRVEQVKNEGHINWNIESQTKALYQLQFRDRSGSIFSKSVILL